MTWRQIAKSLADALAAVPRAEVWRDAVEGDSFAESVIRVWEEESAAAGIEWTAAERDACIDELFNPGPDEED